MWQRNSVGRLPCHWPPSSRLAAGSVGWESTPGTVWSVPDPCLLALCQFPRKNRRARTRRALREATASDATRRARQSPALTRDAIFVRSALDIALLAAQVKVDEGKGRAGAFVARFNGDHVLVVFSPHFQFRDWAGIVALTLERFGLVIFIGVRVGIDIAAMFASVAFQHLAVFFQFIPIVVDDLSGRVVGIVLGH